MIEGVIVRKLKKNYDDRGFFEEIVRTGDDFFTEGFGQLSHSMMVPGVIKAWHIHKSQIDWWFVSRGTLKVVLFDLRDNSRTVGKIMEITLGEVGENAILKIPPRIAHGCKVIGKEKAELFYITSTRYNPQEEEGRLPFDDSRINYNWFK